MSASPFAHVPPFAGDPILSLNEDFGRDPRPDKVNLGIGVYLDEHGILPQLAAVREAECRVFQRGGAKPYLPMSGAPDYRHLAQELAFGADAAVLRQGRVATIQTLGGSGALRIGADFLKASHPASGAWVSDPTWENHYGLLGGCGIEVQPYPYYDPATGGIALDRMLHTLSALPARSIVVLHACCHNPTGVDPSPAEWEAICQVIADRGLIAFVDMAYQGFGRGMDEDARVPRMLAQAGASFLLACSFSKNLSLYGERCGALHVVCGSADEAVRVQGQLQAAVRRNYSNPPTQGAALIATVLADEALRASWLAELSAMRERIADMRVRLRAALQALLPAADYGYLTRQQGLFSYTGLSPEHVDRLRQDSAIYLLRSGRMCMAGLTPANLPHVARAIAATVAQPQPAPQAA
ncbi:aromatic amino acid transaminase [Bordetella genomosp. 12]|uniref:Aromatic amino acid aminotransferase n=1 Tax=Bordetella genomosp. 12 TaxID=463035 RepID=A0A261VD88_9BORD|nr:amino acid aminotransferase [Bordetella genomosp. 12]OZI71807.1 aromatic amino acid aminotransferase [Bordetella genomosp. 12]